MDGYISLRAKNCRGKMKDLISQKADVQKKKNEMPQRMMEEYTTIVSGMYGL